MNLMVDIAVIVINHRTEFVWFVKVEGQQVKRPQSAGSGPQGRNSHSVRVTDHTVNQDTVSLGHRGIRNNVVCFNAVTSILHT